MGDVKDKIKSFENLKPIKYNPVQNNSSQTQTNIDIIESYEFNDDNVSNIEKDESIEPKNEIKLNDFEPVKNNNKHSYCYFLCQYCQDIRNIVDQYQ